jgi:SEC-C motif
MTSRNQRCPCGSGLKYKHCCGGAPAPLVEMKPIWEMMKAEGLVTAEYADIQDVMLSAIEADNQDLWDLMGATTDEDKARLRRMVTGKEAT